MPNHQFCNAPNFIASNNFDYQQLNHKTRLQIEELTTDIKKRISRCAQDIIEIGNNLSQIKQQLQHGQFRAWLKTEFDWSVSTANKFMQVSRQFKPTDLEEIEIAPSALYILAAPSTPETVRTQALSQAKQGKRITYAIAQQLVKDSKTSDDQVKLPEKDRVTVSVLPDKEQPKIDPKLSDSIKIKDNHADVNSKIYSLSDFQNYLNREWRRMSREKRNLALIFCQISVENSKELTPLSTQIIQHITYGFAETLKRPGDFAGTYSKNQCAAVLPQTDSEGANCVASRFLNWFMTWKADVVKSSNSRQEITINLGVAATRPDPENSYALLLKKAQLALSEAQNQGSNQIVTQDDYLRFVVNES
ncbi:MAG: diguanylate cyclase [Cyanobacteria bacterium P01_G01_bin.49]